MPASRPQQQQHHFHHHHRPRPASRPGGSWLPTNTRGIFYRPQSLADQQRPSCEHLPSPLIGPRRSRPHAIHIVTFPPGYIPRELRPDAALGVRPPRARGRRPSRSVRADTAASKACTSGLQRANSAASYIIQPLLGKLIAPFSGRSLSKLCPAASRPATATTATTTPPAHDDVPDALAAHIPSESRASPLPSRSSRPHSHRHSPHHQHQHQHHPSAAADMAAVAQNLADMAAVAGSLAVPSSAHSISGRRNSLMSVRSAKSVMTSTVAAEVPKPVASGSGVSCSILLAERNIFLHGFDHDGHLARDGHGGTALLRGKLQLNVSKNIKIKAVQLKLIGRARTEWPEGIPPMRQELSQEESLRTQVLTFFNVMHDGWESEYGNQCTYQLKTGSANSSSTNLSAALPDQRQRPVSLLPPSAASSRNGLTAKQLKRLSLQSTQSRSFGKGENGAASTPQAKGYKVFYPGAYDYNFELPIDHHQLETIKLQYGSVKWELHASVDRAGAFKPKLHGVKELSVVRLPDQMSLEMSEPISISRQWEDQLHYDIVISGKSFPIGSKMPIAFKLTPLAKVQVHKLKVYVTESIEYWTNDRRATRKEPPRKILLLEKAAGKPLDSDWATSEVNTLQGGELSPEQRRRARETASLRRTREAAQQGRRAEPLPEPTDNLLGDLDLGLEHMWGATEIEANVQLPTCQMMAKHKDLRLHADCSWKNVNVYHWIKIVLRISRVDPEDPTGTRRRHFEISIDSPFTVLNCRATQANTNLPAYTRPTSQPARFQCACGCPDAATLASEGTPDASSGTLPGMDNNHPAADYPDGPWRAAADGSQGDPRPIHLLRVPSFQPPPFDDDTAPPPAAPPPNPEAAAPLMSPPPQYDVVVGTPSVDGLADYFARLADHGFGNDEDDDDDDDDDSASDLDEHPPRILGRSGQVNVCNPRTPGGGRMPSRSFEMRRPAMDLGGVDLARRAGGRAGGG
ncbi:hypothetical protein E4U41_003737 [Claviceps citrina]|nr:hypothetical protein E4U41_003737 [Claviceps citrina]